jgi:hypothetical protein
MERHVTKTDGNFIRQKAVEHNVKLITSVPVAHDFINQLHTSRV